MEHLSKVISKKTSVVIAAGWAILQTEDFKTQIVIAIVAVAYMIIDAAKQIIQIVRKK